MRAEIQSLAPPANGRKNNGRFFYGREALFSAVQMDLRVSLENPIVLFGEAGFGKTAVLQQIADGRLGTSYFPVFIDLKALANGSLSRFWWDFAQIGLIALQTQDTELAPLPKEQFVTAPFHAFQTHFMQPLLAASNGRIPLFLCDNADEIWKQLASMLSDSSETSDVLFDQITRFFHDPLCGTIIVFENTPDSMEPVLSQLLNAANSYAVGSLDSDLSGVLIAADTDLQVPEDVGVYVQNLTAGQPAALQSLRQALAAHPYAARRRQLTIADVVSVYRGQVGADLTTAVPSFTLTPDEKSDQVEFGNGRFLRRSIFVLLIFLVPLSIFFWFSQQTQPKQVVETVPLIIETKKPIEAVSTTETSISPIAPAMGLSGGMMETETAVAQTPETQLTTIALTATPVADDKPTKPELPTTVITREIDAMPMLLIPAGSFLMGSEEGDFIAAEDEFPQQEVTLESFYMDKYEVSTAQYANFLNQLGTYLAACGGEDCISPRERAGNTSYTQEEDLGGGNVQYIPLTGTANFPMNFVNWFGAKAYCDYVGGRLPTEAEWEYAARGADGRSYPWGNDPPGQGLAVFQTNFDDLKPVDALEAGASPFGIFAMAGSMWEWTADWYAEDQYSQGIQNHLNGPEIGFVRVLRGGAWPENNKADRIRSANRHSMDPTFFSGAVGFRCVSDIEGLSIP